MKQYLVFLIMLLVCGCACSVDEKPASTPAPTPSASAQPQEKKVEDVIGEETQFGTPIVSLTMKEGKITEISIDEITGDTTKKAMGEEYKLSDSALDSWANQIAFLENYLLEHDVNDIQTDENGKAVEQDLLSGCTIQIENILKTVRKAMNESQ